MHIVKWEVKAVYREDSECAAMFESHLLKSFFHEPTWTGCALRSRCPDCKTCWAAWQHFLWFCALKSALKLIFLEQNCEWIRNLQIWIKRSYSFILSLPCILFEGYCWCLAETRTSWERLWRVAAEWNTKTGKAWTLGWKIQAEGFHSWTVGIWWAELPFKFFNILMFTVEYLPSRNSLISALDSFRNIK